MTSFISYAQNFEDVMLWRALNRVEGGFYIDVGAHHPVIDSVSKAFYERGWRGIHVEPTQHYADLLRQDRPGELVIQAALSDRRGTITLYEMAGLSTGISSIAQRHREQGIDSQETNVPCLKLDDVFAEAGEHEIHWLKIDVEGMERQVLSGWQCPRLPWIVVIESTLPNLPDETWSEWEPLMLEKGYQLAYFDGLNRFYVSPRHAKLEATLRVSPNVFDRFSLHGDSSAPFCDYVNQANLEREQELQRHIDELNESVSSLRRDLDSRKYLQRDLERQHEERERLLSNRLSGLAQEAQQEKQLLSEAFTGRERELTEQFRATREQLDSLTHRSAEKEKLLCEKFADAADASQRQRQSLLRELQISEQTHYKAIIQLHSDMAERERVLSKQIADLTRVAEQEKQALLRELLIREESHSQKLDQLHRKMYEHSASLIASNIACERELRERIAAMSDERDCLERGWKEREHALLRDLMEKESHAASLAELHRELDKQAAQQTAANHQRERLLAVQIESLRHERSLLMEAWNGYQQETSRGQAANNETQKTLLAKLAELEERIRNVTIENAVLGTRLNQLKHVQDEVIAMKMTVSWRATAPFRVLTRMLWFRDARHFRKVSTRLSPATTSQSQQEGISTESSPPLDGNIVHPTPSISLFGINQSVQQLELVYSMKSIKHIDQLLDLHGSDFVETVYRALLNRSADSEGMNYYLGRLRLGYGKASVISQIAQSPEARIFRTQIPGLNELVRLHKRSKHWLSRYFFKQPDTITQLQRLEYLIENCKQQTDTRLLAIERSIDSILQRLEHLKRDAVAAQMQAQHQAVAVDDQPEEKTAPEERLAISIIDELILPVADTPAEIIAALEERITASREAACFTR